MQIKRTCHTQFSFARSLPAECVLSAVSVSLCVTPFAAVIVLFFLDADTASLCVLQRALDGCLNGLPIMPLHVKTFTVAGTPSADMGKLC